MYKRLHIVLLLAFAAQFLPANARTSSTPSTGSGETSRDAICKLSHHPSSELDLVYYQFSSGSRVTQVQKDSFSDTLYTCRPTTTRPLFTGLHPLTISSFCKNYIDHIYPSHHFW